MSGTTTFTYDGAVIQTFTVTTTGEYEITAYGAQGGSGGGGTTGGTGAEMAGDFTLTAGEVLTIVVGGKGSGGAFGDGYGGGGGGGSFVMDDGTALIIAGGGGGGGFAEDSGIAGQTGTSGSAGVGAGAGAGGTAGSGGAGGTGSQAGGGGGFHGGNGGNGSAATAGSGQGSGYAGGTTFATGGFGGGGSGGYNGGGGGGGYSGGGGGNSSDGGAGGGGSVDHGTAVTATDALATGQNGNGLIEIEEVSCFLEGTRIATPDGDRPVEGLRIGDSVTAADGAARPIRWIGRRTLHAHGRNGQNGYRILDPLRVYPVRIAAGALGEMMPARDLYLSPDHAVLIDGILIQAGALANGASIRRLINPPETFTYYHIELEDHALILAEGVPAETFVDNVARMGFDNWAEHEALYPTPDPIAEMDLPRAQSRRQVPRRILDRLQDRAVALFPLVSRAA